jgi:tetratricopeptide (TPR) repeat protein
MKKTSPFVETSTTPPQTIDNIEIFFGPFESKALMFLPQKDKELYLCLLNKAQISPFYLIDEARELEKKIPYVPEIDNLLTYILIQNRQIDEAEKRIKESYDRYPDYFFAKINYGDLLLQKKDRLAFHKLFPFSEIQNYFPDKSRYHVTEYRSFYLLMARNCISAKNKKGAKEYFNKAYRADPAHPSVIDFEKQIHKSFINKIKSLINKKQTSVDLSCLDS